MILFKRYHVPLILANMKTQTRRLGEKRWNVGSVHQAKSGYRKDSQFANLEILDIYRERLYDISEDDAKAEGYRSPGDYLQAFRDINEVPDFVDLSDLIVWVVKFRRVGML